MQVHNREHLEQLYEKASHHDGVATRELQQFLHDKVDPKVHVDGKLGPQTKAACRKFFQSYQAKRAKDSFDPDPSQERRSVKTRRPRAAVGGAGASSGHARAPAHRPAKAPSSAAPVQSNLAPGGPINSPEDFAKALLQALGAPLTQANIQSLVNWCNREGGAWNNSAHFNPLNTTQNAPGAARMNSVGVKAYTSWTQGIQATADTLRNGGYNDLVAALQSGNGLSHGRYAGLRTWSGGGYSSI